jgi:hypothetical protein
MSKLEWRPIVAEENKPLKFKKNKNGIYTLYLTSTGWRESATITNDKLNNLFDYEICEESEGDEVIYLSNNNKITFNCEPSFLHCDWSISIEGVKRTLTPNARLTSFELYNITVWKEECQANLNVSPVKLKSRAIELGIWDYFI